MLTPEIDQAIAEAAERPQARQRIANWQRSLGQAASAARWQRWALLPPTPEELKQATQELLLEQGRGAHVLELEADAPSWERLEALLQAEQVETAADLQQQLLLDPPPISQERFLAIAALWQDQQQPTPALTLLLTFAQQCSQQQQLVPVPLCNAIAKLHEQLDTPEDAEPWWATSIQQQPQQPAVLMRLARLEQRRSHWRESLHYCRQVLQLDPAHPWALDLQLEALLQLSAARSAALALELRHQHHPERELPAHLQNALDQLQNSASHSEPLDCTPLSQSQIPSEGYILLVGSPEGEALSSLWCEPTGHQLVWAIGSPEPLLLEQVALDTMAAGWQLIQRPRLEPNLLSNLGLVVWEGPISAQHTTNLESWIKTMLTPEQVLRWDANQRRWIHGG